MLELFDAIARAARLPVPVVVCGATGTGKELVARALHELGGPSRPFVAINVSGMPETLLDSELFGTVRGAFTGAGDRTGLVEAADKGVLFLDEATALPQPLQVKLLRVLESGELRRLGSTLVRRTRLQLILAVHRDPSELRTDGGWREDFYYRAAGVVLRVPRLSERPDDIEGLARHFVAKEGLPALCAGAASALRLHHWPGNVRELHRVLVRASFLTGSARLDRQSITAAIEELQASVPGRPKTLRDVRVAHVRRVVAAARGDTSEAARILGVTRRHIYRLIEEATTEMSV